jgi:hypothetical protein
MAAERVGPLEAGRLGYPPHWSRAKWTVPPLVLGRQYRATPGPPPLPCRPCSPAARLAKTGRARVGSVAVEPAVEQLAAEAVRAGRARGWRQCAAAPELRGCFHAGRPPTTGPRWPPTWERGKVAQEGSSIRVFLLHSCARASVCSHQVAPERMLSLLASATSAAARPAHALQPTPPSRSCLSTAVDIKTVEWCQCRPI